MDPRDPEKGSRAVRRSTRLSPMRVLTVNPRGPLKRTKKKPEGQAAVNGSRNEESGTEDEESPRKMSRLEAEGGREGGEDEDEEEGGGGGGGGDAGDDNEMDVEEPVDDLEKSDRPAKDVGQNSSHSSHQPQKLHGLLGDVNLSPLVVLGERCRPRHADNEDANRTKAEKVKPSIKGPVTLSKSSLEKKLDLPIPNKTSMAQYKKKMMEATTMSTGIHRVNHHITSTYSATEKPYTTRQRLNNIPPVQHKRQVSLSEGKKKTAANKGCPKGSRGLMWYLCRLILLVLLSCSVAFFMPKVIAALQRGGGGASGTTNLNTFADRVSRLEARFLGQRSDLWKRSRIHLERHLNAAQPTEPVSLILTAGRRAETTLRCLAQGLAAAFASALNASVLHIDGAARAGQDSDQVKLDVDRQLRAAFEGDKPAAVIHRLEELPPGSTLIFYRYCDHETAAYKRVFLLFTVLLPEDEVASTTSLKNVEERVHDHLKDRLVGSSKQTTFNEMDANKFGGLWSRISHLILPLVSEAEIEQNGCS